MERERLEGGYADGAVRVGDTVRRMAGPWTPAVHALLGYLAGQGFTGAPRPLGFDAQGREVLTFLEGETIGHRKPRPAWVHAEDALVQVARWMRDFHQVAAGFVPPPGAVWREGTLTGFFDWDFAGPATAEWDLALTGFTTGEFLDMVEARMTAHAAGIRDKAAAGDQASGRLLRQGVPDAIDQALADLASFPR
jgi:hypothetical protein